MGKKYYMTIHILFWTLTVIFIIASGFIMLMQNGKIGPFFFAQENKTIVEKEPVYITEIKEIEKETEWYYFVATAYSADDPVQGTNSTTATGRRPAKGVIAVDPKVIPLGTVVEIKDMGFFVAQDTGGKIKGNRIDIYFETKDQAREFGRKGVWLNIPQDNFNVAELDYSMILQAQ